MKLKELVLHQQKGHFVEHFNYDASPFLKKANLRLSLICFLGFLAGAHAGSAGPRELYPRPELTPGKANMFLTEEVICSHSFRTGPYRNVPLSEKREVFRRYNIPFSSRSNYEVDHFISLELGGSNDISNLWPEPYLPRPGAKEKDVIENYLHREVCNETISLKEAQKELTQDWYKIYLQLK